MASIFERESAAGLIEPKQQIEDMARRSKVPVNVLLSAAELGGARDDAERIKIAESVAAEFGPRVQAGESVKALIREAAGNDEAASAFISRAKQIAEEMYPDQVNAARASKTATQTGGMGTALGVGVDALQQGYGSAIEGLGKSTGLEGVEKYGADVAAHNKAQIMEAAPGMTGVDEIDGIGSAAKFAGETFAQQIPQLGVSIGAGVAGAKAGGALGAALGPGGAAAGAVIGGIGGGILANIPYFYGSNRERQKESIEQGILTEVDEGSAFLSSIPQAALDTIVDRVMVGAIAGPMAKAGGGLLTRAGMGAAQGVVAEVPTEIGQSMIERYQAGLPLDTEDAIKEYRDVGIAAGLIGGTLGGVGGAIQSKPPAGPMRSALDKSGGAQRQFPEDAEGQAATLGGPVGVSPLAPTGAPVQVPQLFPDQKPGKELRLMDPETGEILDATFLSEGPEGVQVRIAGGIVDLSPEEFDASVSAAKQTEEAAKPAKGAKKAPKAPKVALTAADATAFPAEPEPTAESGFDAPAAALQEQGFYDLPQDQWDGVTPEPAPVFDEPAPEPDMGPDTAAADALKEQGFYDLSETAAPKTPRGPKPAAPDFTPDEALKRAKQIEDTASRGGWNARLKKKHAEFMAIVEAGNATDNLGTPSPETPVADQGNFTGPQEADRGDVARANGQDDMGGAGFTAGPGAGKDMAPAGAEPEPVPELTKPRAPVAPITTSPDERIQPDMLGGAATNETEMARKERRKREWGQYLAIAEKTKSPWDGEIEGRVVTVRPGKVKIRARADGPSDLDYTLDTEGMDRDEIAARTRGALNELDRVSPIERPTLPPPAVAASAPAAKPVDASQKPDSAAKDETPASVAPASAPTVTDIREKAAVLRGIPKDAPPNIPGVSLKWDDNDGGFIFSRKHKDKVLQAVATPKADATQAPATSGANDPYPALLIQPLRGGEPTTQYNTLPNGYRATVNAKGTTIFDPNGKALMASSRKMERDEIVAYANGESPRNPVTTPKQSPWVFKGQNAAGNDVFEDQNGVRSYVEKGVRVTEPISITPTREGGLSTSYSPANRGSEFKTQQEAEPATPAAADIEAAAKAAATDPTDAQKDAGNYQKGHVKWAGLDISIENAKGSLRKGKDKAGNEWSVKMPAHYGYIKRTTGADGDQIDVYMGDKPESDVVVVVDQVDAETQMFDEHKVMAGFENRKTALDFYVQGFSDGKGAQRLGAHKVMTVAEFKEWAANGDTTKPVRLSAAKVPAKAAEEPMPKIPAGYTLGSVIKMDAARAARVAGDPDSAGGDWGKGDFHAVISRDQPYSVVGGYGKTRAEAIQNALKRVQDKAPLYKGKEIDPPLSKDEAFASGQKAFKEKYARVLPDDFAMLASPSVQEEWYRGWDAANIAAPVNPEANAGSPQKADLNAEPAKPAYGATNTLVSADRAAELRKRLQDKLKNQLNAGIDPEILAIGAELAVFHIEAGARRFVDLARAIAGDLGTTPGKIRPYLRSWYNGARDMMEDAGLSIDGMDDASAVRAALAELDADEAASQNAADSAKVESQPTKEGQNEQRGNQAGDQGELAGKRGGNPVDAEAGRDVERDGDGRGEGDQDRTGSDAGPEPDGSMVRDPGRVSDGAREPRVGEAPPNFTISDDFALGEGTDGQKLAANLAALRLVQKLEAENRFATPDEQAVLARWVGWGGLKTLFDEKHAGTTSQWGKAQAELKTLLTKAEYFDAMRSTNDAHYTSRTVVKAMWQAMRGFGFSGGRALEPTIGSGNFLGLQPEDMSAATEWYASELDPVTGKIAKHLYPRATVFDGMGFQDAPFRRGTFDIAIGNPPFGGDASRVGNKDMHPDLGRMKVHNFVIAKTGQLLREGGIMGMVVTHRFLDAMDAEARDVLAPNFHFLGAVRLPNTAFKENAGTEVTTDIVFFQKRRAGDEAGDTSWLDTGAVGPNGTTLNAWFANNPDMILGRPAMDGTMYAAGRKSGGEFTVHDDGRDLAAALTEAMSKIKASLPGREQLLEDAVSAPQSVATLSYGEAMVAEDGRIYRGDQDSDGRAIVEEITADSWLKDVGAAQFALVEALRPMLGPNRDFSIEQTQAARDAAVVAGLLDLAGDPLKLKTKYEQAVADAIPAIIFGNATPEHAKAVEAYAAAVEKKRLGHDGFDRLKAILRLRNGIKSLIRAERDDNPAMEQMRSALARDYRAFREAYGPLNNPRNEAVLKGDVGPEMALETKYRPAKKEEGRPETAEEAPILSKRVIFPHKLPENMESVSDATHVSMQERGFIDPGLIAQLTNKTPAEVVAELTGGEQPLAFKNPSTGHFELAEVYLSGNLAEKIQKAAAARAYDHIPHLKAAMPAPKTQAQITPSIRSMWIPRDVFEDFLRALGYSNATVMIAEKVGMVEAVTRGDASSDFGRQFNTARMDAGDIFSHAIKGKIPIVFDKGADDKRVKNEEATREAVAAYERMTAEFPQWAYANPMRAERIVAAFNEKVNVVTPRKYEGTRYLRTVGISPNVELRNSQKNGAWRMIQDKVTLLHHVVGAGKTMTGITGVMERKRMGLTRKAVVVVPNHLTGQWGKEWLELYPAANILVPNEKDFEAANRSKLINRIATGNFDAVIIGHSQLVKIENDPDVETKYIEEELDALNDAMQQQKKSGESKRSVGQMGTRISKLKEKLQAAQERIAKRKDAGVVSWKDLGVDYMVLDESQEFKNLEYSTTATQLVGMNDPGGSQKAFDLLLKLRSLQAMPNGGATFMTGTPISNSLVEIYTVMKYMIPDSLESMGIKHFDAWKAAFIQDESRFEYTASMQLKERNVMAGMVNLGPLAELYRSFADIVMRPDVERMYREQMEAKNAAEPDKTKHVSTRFPTPKVKSGKRRILLAPPTGRMEEFTRYLVMRMAGIKNAPDKKAYAKIDNPLWVLTDARKASVDIRTIDPEIGREEGSKVTRSADEVFRIWKASADRRGTQMVFSDMSTPSKSAAADARASLRAAYQALGLKKEQIKARMAGIEGRSFTSLWSDVVGEIEDAISSPATDDSLREDLALFIESPDARDAGAAMFTADSGFSFYDDLRDMLIEKGVPAAEIAFIHDYDTTAKKKDLFEAVNDGKIRVLIGSTMKMGAGTNAQKRLVALHHIDAPWRPSDMEQREGRIIRQGNLFYEQDPDGFEVEILAYSTEKTADVVQWQVLERKAKAIETFLGAATDSLEEEGSDADQYAEFMAQSTGKKVFLEKMQVEKALLHETGAISSALRSRSEAVRFIDGFAAEQTNLRARSAALAKVSAEMFPAGSDLYLSSWAGQVEAYRAEKAKVEAEIEAIRARNTGKPRKEWEKHPDLPSAPKRWQTRPENAWEATVYDALKRAQENPAGGPHTIRLNDDARIEIFTSALGDGPISFTPYLVVKDVVDDDVDIALESPFGVTAKDFRNSDKLLSSLDPANILFRAQERAKSASARLASHKAMLPQMKAIAEKPIDDSKVKVLQTRLAALTAETRIEEVRYTEETAKAGENHFALIDTKGRNLDVSNDVKPLTGEFQFKNAGRSYSSEWGAPAGRKRIDGTDKFGDVAYFEANDMDSGEAVIVEAIQMPKQEGEDVGRWEAINVFAMSNDGTMEMRGPRRAPVATLTGEELGAWEDIRQLGKKADAWYRANLVGKTVKNKAGGMVIGFNGRGARKIGGRKGADIYRSVVALREILADGQIIETLPDKAGRENVTAIHKIAASVSIAGQTVDLVATVREMTDGTFHYDLSKDFDGEAKGSATLTARDESRASALEGGLADVNIEFADDSGKSPAGWGEVEADPPLTEGAMQSILADLKAEAAVSGLEGKITVRLVRNLVNAAGVQVQGMFGRSVADGAAGIQVRAGAEVGEIGVMRHEIIHALRSESLWGRPFGLFTGPEWRALAMAAKADAGIRKNVLSRYPDLSPQKQTEEMVAELYRLWAGGRDTAGPVARALERAKGFLMAVANALRGRGFVSASRTMEQIATGKIGGRGPQGPGGGGRRKGSASNASYPGDQEMRGGMLKARAKFAGIVGSKHWRNPGELVSNTISDAMTGKGDYSLLALVPGRALFSELGKRLPSVGAYLRTKEDMDSLRNDWHSKADETAQKWLKLRNKMPRENDAFMDLMHRTTLAGIDPSRPDTWKHAMEGAARNAYDRDGENSPQWVFDVQKQIEAHRRAYGTLRQLFEALPEDFQRLYSEVRSRYDKLGDDFEAAVLENIRNATKIGLKRAQRAYDKEMERIKDEGLEGEELEEAVSEAERKLKAVKQRGGFTARARINTLRKVFESNRLKGPYFPLARFGDYFVTIRDEKGKVVSFSRFEKESQQQAFIREQKGLGADRIQYGVMSNKASLKGQVDPTFVADVENMLAEAGADDATMDAIWQRWLETLPDQSIRTSKIHRKGRQGWSSDAYRAFGKHMFHGAHQLARLKYGILLEDHVDEAELEAKVAQDPNRAMQVVNEVRKRHDFTMSPTGSSAVAGMSSLAFVWYLGATPAAALANVSQTTVVGPPLMAARFRKAGVSGSISALGKASADFLRGRGSSWKEQWSAENSPNLTPDERAAMAEAIRRGTIDKTQAHDLASVAETGIEYNAVREKWMRRIGWFFHHAERFNREVTFLANYRLAKAEGLEGEAAIDAAADLTWKIHFDYQNTSRPRFMQNDLGKVLTTFRQFTVNMLWRLARDGHQSLKGATAEERREARLQLAGITLSMMAHAGIRGTWGYGLAMLLLGALTPGGDGDDIEEWMQDALLMEGDGAGVAAWNFIMGAALNGVPGQILGVDLKERIGMPNMWFRGSDRDLEGDDLYNAYLYELLGPVVGGIGPGIARGASLVADGEIWRGTEAAIPKFLRDLMKAGRYSMEGVETLNGDTILDGLNPYEVLMQASGFTPAKVAERYDINTRLKNEEREILDRRREIHRAAGDAISAGKQIPASVIKSIRQFNRDFPEYPITGDTLRQSMQSRARAHQKAEFGVTLNEKLNDRLRGERAPQIYD